MRKIKDAKDLNGNELIYFKGHAKATYMSDGSTVEDNINQLKNNSGSGGNIDLSDYETKSGSQAKLQEAKDYTDSQISELKEGLAVQTFDFSEAGTHWISFYIETSLEELCNALGSNGTKISTSTDNTGSENLVLEYNTETGSWSGSLTEIDPLRMYMVTVSAPCTVSLKGKKLDAEKSVITLNPGWNWISYPSDKEISLSEAFVNLNVRIGDQVKGHLDTTTYYGGNYGWFGGLETLTPGQGYMYKNSGTETRTLIFSSGEPNYIYETKIDAQVKLEEAKEYTDSRISEIKERVVSQTIELHAGWNWVSFYINVELADLQNALGSNGLQIKDYAGKFTTYNSAYGFWSDGRLATIQHNEMYMINVKESCSITLEGKKLDPDKINILIYGTSSSYSTSWISYPLSLAAELDKALVNVPVVAGDVIKSYDGESEYIEGYGWDGDLTIMEPGKGYQYISNSAESFNFKYPSLEVDVEAELAKKQNTLISGENIKTINGESLLGEGNITIESLPEIPEDSDGKLLKVAGNEYSLKHLTSDDIKKEIYIYLKAGINYVTIFSSYNATAVGGRQVMREVKEQLGDKCEYIKLYENDGTGTLTETTTTYNIETGLWEGELDSITRDACYVFKMTQTLSISYFTKPINPGATTKPYLYTGQNYLPFTFHKNKTVKEIIEQLTALTPASFNDKLVINHTYTFMYEDIGNGTGKWFPYGDYSDNFSVRPGSGMVYVRTSSNMGVVEWLDDTWDIPDNTVKYIQSQTSECKSHTDDKISSLGVIPQIVYIPNEASMPNPPVEGVLYLIGDEEV